MPTLADFLARALPWPAPGQPGVVNLHWRSWKSQGVTGSKPFSTLEDLLSYVDWAQKAGATYIRELYYCTSLQRDVGEVRNGRQTARRDRENTICSKAFFADIDKGYESPGHALKAVAQMCRDTGSPMPTAVVVSGNGLHVYWFSTVAFAPPEWGRYARALDTLLTDHGITHDAVTTDITRILRPPGTFNNKGHEKGISPKPVVFEFLAPADIDFSAWDALKAAAPAQLTSQGLVAPQHKIPLEELFVDPAEASKPPSKIITDALKPEDWITDVLDPTPIFACPMFKHTLETHGEGIGQPLWMQQALACTFIRDGEQLFHELSKGHSTYTYNDTEAMFARKVGDRVSLRLGYPSCATFESYGSRQCKTCSMKGKITSPLNLPLGRPGRVTPDQPVQPQSAGLPHDMPEARGWSPDASFSAAAMDQEGDLNPLKQTLLLSSAEFVGGFLPPDYLIDGLLQRRYVYSLTAPTGAGKTCIALYIAMCVALGMKLSGLDVEKGRVLFFAGENPDDIRSRWIKLCEVMGQKPDDVEISFMPGTPPISNPEIRQRIDAEAEKHGPFSLLIVDTSAAYFQGDDENSNKQLGDHARLMRTFTELPGGPSVLVTCHPTKTPDMSNLVPRGGGAFLAEVDGNLVAIKHSGSMIVELNTHGKFRGPEFSPISFKIVPGTSNKLVDTKGRSIWTVTATPITQTERDGIDNSTQANYDDLLVMMKNRPGLSLAGYAEALNWRNGKGELNKRLVQTATIAMTKDKLIEKKNERYCLTSKGKRAATDAELLRKGKDHAATHPAA